jgi:hypothetical protein
MLRAFLEEVRWSRARDVLQSLAYDHQPTNLAMVDTADALAQLTKVYPQLHRRLLRQSKRLHRWTAGTVTRAALLAMTPPYEELERWLFGT